MKNLREVKKYFKTPGTVSTWWEPTEGDKSHIFQRQLELLEEMLVNQSSSKVLDVACGKGRISQTLINNGLETYSLDISPEMLDIAKQRGCIQRPILGDAENLPFENNTFEVVTCFDALVHFPNPLKTIKEAYRVMKEEGIYIINTSNPYDLGFLPRKLSECVRQVFNPKSRNKGEGIFRYISPKKMKVMLKKVGFRIEEERRQGLLAPIEIRLPNNRDVYLFSEELSRRYDKLDRFLETVPILNRFCISAVYKAIK